MQALPAKSDSAWSATRNGPAGFLASFKGYLHADAFAGYDGIYLLSDGSIIEVACWAHARRKFFDAKQSNPRQAHQILEWIRQLYDIEDRAADLNDENRRALRWLRLLWNRLTAVCNKQLTVSGDEVARLTDLQDLWLGANSLTRVPVREGMLEVMRVLHLGSNQLERVPD